MIDNDCYIFSY